MDQLEPHPCLAGARLRTTWALAHAFVPCCTSGGTEPQLPACQTRSTTKKQQRTGAAGQTAHRKNTQETTHTWPANGPCLSQGARIHGLGSSSLITAPHTQPPSPNQQPGLHPHDRPAPRFDLGKPRHAGGAAHHCCTCCAACSHVQGRRAGTHRSKQRPRPVTVQPHAPHGRLPPALWVPCRKAGRMRPITRRRS